MRRDPDLHTLARNPGEAEGISRLGKMRCAAHATKPDAIPADVARGLDAVPFQWRLVGGTDKQEARAAAVVRLSRLGIPLELQGAQDLNDECEWQLLARAMRLPEDADQPLARDVDELRDLLTEDEKALLITRYLDFEEERDPAVWQLSEVEVRCIAEAAKKKPCESVGPLMSFGSRTLALFITSTAGQQASSATGTSGGSPASARI